MRPAMYRLLFVLATLAGAAAPAAAQTRWAVDATLSLAWWQINPHLGHLWATTCPEEPSWRPGEGRSAGWLGQSFRGTPAQGNAGVNDTTVVPLYPRYEVLVKCTEAVQGEVLVADTAAWRGVSGLVSVRSEALVTGEARRDAFTRQTLLDVTKYPEMKFRIDSLVDVSRNADTTRATAVGMLTLRDVTRPMTAGVRAWPEAGGLRVLARLRVPAPELTHEWGLSRFALGLGVNTGIWYDLFMGVDVLLRPQGTSAN